MFTDLLKKNNIKYGYLSAIPHSTSTPISGEKIDFKIDADEYSLNYDDDILLYKNGNLLLKDPTEDEFKEIITTENKTYESKEDPSNNREESKEKTDSEILAELLENKTFINKKEEDTQLMNKLLDILIDPSVKDGVKQLTLDKCKEYLELTFEDTDIDESYFKIKESFKNKIWESLVIENEEPKECYILLRDILCNIMNDGVEFKEIENLCNKIRNSEHYNEEIKCELCNKLVEFNENWFTDLNKANIDCNNILLLAE
jgi:hypothetical protein